MKQPGFFDFSRRYDSLDAKSDPLAALNQLTHLFPKNAMFTLCRPNDRLLLGMKGSISEFELGVDACLADAAAVADDRGSVMTTFIVTQVAGKKAG